MNSTFREFEVIAVMKDLWLLHRLSATSCRGKSCLIFYDGSYFPSVQVILFRQLYVDALTIAYF